jgi:hypothetical protein
MLDIGTRLPAKPIADQASPVTQAQMPAKSSSKAGTVVLLSPEALDISRGLQAIQSNPDKEPVARLAASEKLRQLALKVFSGG